MPSNIQTFSIAAVVLGSLASAPVQCARDPNPDRAVEDEPGEALYGLAEQFQQRGETNARKDTLLYIVRRYPSSRFAASAKRDLDTLGVDSDAGPSP